MSDEIRRLSDELARDPSSLVFIPLGDALRKQGQAALALKVALRGLERHPHNADAHDLLARIAVDRGELQRAFDEWDMVLRFAPAHAGAKKGMGFVCFQQGRLEEAERYLADAHEADTADQSIASALAHVRARLGRPTKPAVASAAPAAAPLPSEPPPRRASGERMKPLADPPWLAETLSRSQIRAPEPPPAPEAPAAQLDPRDREALMRGSRALFADLIGDADQTALLLDAEGFVLAGAYLAGDGRDVAQEVGAELSGVSDEAQRAMRHLDLGDWTQIIVETEVAVIALAPAARGGLLLAAADRTTPLGMVRRFLDRAVARARVFVGGDA